MKRAGALRALCLRDACFLFYIRKTPHGISTMRCFNDPCTLQAFQLYPNGKHKNIGFQQ
nr:MAG TPA: hypothetical protein [Caudoviricetes sp.]